ncbi:MAG: hypothetical protein Greene071436_89 [Parcubacteria group bacterium Greene0714_36]|nr:MAG: hypothetical protein Greene071436_89 [Parcubacteria group bacterium Greene0714_36]
MEFSNWDGSARTVRMGIYGTSGNVGIGTTSPGTLLAVQGAVSMFLQGTVTTNGVCHTGNATDAADSTVGRQLVVCSGAGVDIAEWYPTKSDVAVGDIIAPSSETMEYQAKGNDPVQGTEVSLGTQKISLLKKAERSDTILGIVSTAPFKTFGTDIRAYASSTRPRPVALSGRVPVNVNLEGGEIHIGDRIALSSVAGVGTKATTSGMTVGVALEGFDGTGDGGTGKVMTFVNLGYARLDAAIPDLVSNKETKSDGELATNAWIVDQQSGKVSVSFMGDINMQGNAILDVGKITGYLGKWSIDEGGTLMAVKVITDELIAQKVTVGSATVPSGITLYDEVTKAPYCVKIVSGAVVPQAGACGTSSAVAAIPDLVSSLETKSDLPAGGETSTIATTTTATLDTTATSTPTTSETATSTPPAP